MDLGVWEGLRFVIVALPGLFSYLFLKGPNWAHSAGPIFVETWKSEARPKLFLRCSKLPICVEVGLGSSE